MCGPGRFLADGRTFSDFGHMASGQNAAIVFTFSAQQPLNITVHMYQQVYIQLVTDTSLYIGGSPWLDRVWLAIL